MADENEVNNVADVFTNTLDATMGILKPYCLHP
jgi:hypothetical protein